MTRTLFSESDLDAWLSEQTRRAITQVVDVPVAVFGADPQASVDAAIVAWIVEPVEIDWASQEADAPREVKAIVRERGEVQTAAAHGIAVHIPYRGSMRVFELRPNTYSTGGMPRADVRQTELIIDITLSSADVNAFESAYQREKQGIEIHIGYANAQIRAWQSGFRAAIQTAGNDRSAQLEAGVKLATAISIPARRRDAEKAVPVPAIRKSIRPIELKHAPSEPAEYALDDAIYEDVVRTLRAVGNSFERLPATTRKFQEEELRDVLLFILSGNYEGQAGGELFNGSGKTDILVRWHDRNAFVGECKFWSGEKAFSDAIDQLAGYTVWRDTKAALILFIKNKDASAVIEKADAVIRRHRSFWSVQPALDPNLRRDYVMSAMDDRSRRISLALLPIVVRNEVESG